MPNIQSTKKRMRQNLKRRLRNRTVKSSVRTQLGKFRSALERGDVNAAQQEFQAAVRSLDKAAARGIVHKRTAARRKSRLAAKLRRLAAAAPQA